MLKDFTKNSHKPGRKPKPINLDDLRVARLSIEIAHKSLKTWDAVAAYCGISKAAAHRIAHDKTYRPSQTTIDKVLSAQPPKPSPKRPPRRFYRPCLPVDLGEQVKASGWDIETIVVTGLAALPRM